MFDANKSPIQLEINRYTSVVDIQIRKLQENLDKLVYWETLYNKENKINKNAENLQNLIAINDILHESTPECYFIEQPEMQGHCQKKKKSKEKLIQVRIVMPSLDVLSTIHSLNYSKTEMFLLKNEMPGKSQKTIMKIENNGSYDFILRTKHKNIEEERAIDAAEYLMLTTQIDVNISRISTTCYTFIYNKRKYNILINNTENTAILEYFESAPIPDFIKIKI